MRSRDMDRVVILTVLKRAGQFDYSTRSAGDDPSPVTSNCIVNKLLEKLSTFPTMAVHPARFRDADPTLPPSYWTRAFLAQPSPTPSAGLLRRAYRFCRRYLLNLSHRSRSNAKPDMDVAWYVPSLANDFVRLARLSYLNCKRFLHTYRQIKARRWLKSSRDANGYCLPVPG
jgi:hypothetical protein